MTRLTVGLLCLSFLLTSAAVAEDGAGIEAAHPRDTVVLLHGFARTRSAVWLLSIRLERAGFRVESIGYDSINRAPDEILEAVSRDIRD